MSPQTLNHALGFIARAELARRAKPARVAVKTQGSRAALAIAHAEGLLDSITDPAMRHAAALALSSLQYVQGATEALMRAELLAAASGTDEDAA